MKSTKKKGKSTKATKRGRRPKIKTVPGKSMSALTAAATVLAASGGRAMTSVALVEQMAAKGLWRSPGGHTPEATVHAAISREIKAKGAASRFAKHPDGGFVYSKPHGA